MSDDLVEDYRSADDCITCFVEQVADGDIENIPNSDDLIWAVLALAKEAGFNETDSQTSKLCVALTRVKGVSYREVASFIEPYRRKMLALIEAKKAKESFQPDANYVDLF